MVVQSLATFFSNQLGAFRDSTVSLFILKMTTCFPGLK